jgi:hypothetical protein
MDFDLKLGFGQCVANELCKISLKDQKQKRRKMRFGVVFNLDNHNESGSHWVCMLCDLVRREICYWDSYAMKPTKEVVTLMNRLKQQAKTDLGLDVVIKVNKIRHQYKNSECGVYCIYFLTSLLDGKKFEDVVKNIVSDDEMNAKRSEFFVKE